jgi:hypothetical protein
LVGDKDEKETDGSYTDKLSRDSARRDAIISNSGNRHDHVIHPQMELMRISVSCGFKILKDACVYRETRAGEKGIRH